MTSNADVQPIDLAEWRATREGGRSRLLMPEQQRAYRQLAIVALGLDIPTLTRELRARRLQRTPALRVLPNTGYAA